MDDNNIGIVDVSYIDGQSELLLDLINKSKNEEEKLSYVKDTLTAIAQEYFRKGIVANSKHNNELTFVGEEYPPLGVCEGTPGTNDRTIKPMGQG